MKLPVRQIVYRVLITGVTLACTLMLLELVVRFAGEQTADGQFVFAGAALQPYALPLQRLAEQVAEYEDNLDSVTLIYDERLGWTYRPDSLRQDGEFTINSSGLRSTREYELRPPADTLRVALFGDSFTAGDDSRDEDAWFHLLELNLNQAGIRTEVLNFGVSAYGMDQAFLRWQHEGSEYSPDIVVFGLQAENLDRNVNVFRQLIHPLGPPFSKPRFILADDALHLVNSPAVPPEQLIEVFKSFDSHPDSVHEAYYESREYLQRWWLGSKLASFMYEVVSQRAEAEQIQYGPESERGRVGRAIVDAFAADVIGQGKSFIIVFLPHQEYFIRRYYGREIPYRYLLKGLSQEYHYISLADYLEPEHRDGKYWGETLHYGPELNQVLAELLASEITDCVQSAACPLERFDDVSALATTSAVSGE